MIPTDFLALVLTPGLDALAILGGPLPTPDVERFLLCVALQESGPTLDARYQNSPAATPGPARGFYQFEMNGGVAGVLQHAASKALAAAMCRYASVIPAKEAVWRAIEGHDELASAFARLLLYTDPHPVPTTQQAAWECYMRVWRPGKPHPDAWPRNWTTASNATLDRKPDAAVV